MSNATEVAPSIQQHILMRAQQIFYELLTKTPPGTTLTWWIDWDTSALYVGESKTSGPCWAAPVRIVADLCEENVEPDEWEKRCKVVSGWIEATASSIAESRINDKCWENRKAAG